MKDGIGCKTNPRDKAEARRQRDGFGRHSAGHQYTCDVLVSPKIKPSGRRKVVVSSDDADNDREGG